MSTLESSEFKKQYKKLNPGQREAVDETEGPVMVIAGPGTGKTQILTLRIANILLKTQINPENILALTFSESAAYQMRERLVEITGTAGYKVEISTFHSFADSIIQNHPEEFGNLISAESITEDEQIEIIEKIVETEDLKILRPWGEPLFYAKDILSAINDLKKENIDPQKLLDALNLQRQDFKKIGDLHYEKGKYRGEMKGRYAQELKGLEKMEEFVKVYQAYSMMLLKEKKYDFNDMLIETVKVLEKNQQLLLLLQEKYQYILVDEHQDTNASQNRLVELLANFYETPNLFVVGDEKQAIYRFQGASLENFLYFQRKYPQAGLINLNLNYRSHQLILDASMSFISKNISANILSGQLNLKAGSKVNGDKIKIACLDDYYGEFEYVADSIEKLIKSGVDPSQIAVLGRRNLELSQLTDFLKRKKIDYVIDADQDILSDLWTAKFLMILESVSDFGNDEKFVKVLHIDILGIDPVSIFKLIQKAKNKRESIFDVLKEPDKEFADINAFIKIFKGWVTLSKNIRFDDLFVKILNESGIRERFLKIEDRNEILQKFITLFESVKEKIFKNPDYSINDFLKRIETLRKHNLSIKTRFTLKRQRGVRILTVHKAKGLEFEYVFIIQCIAGRWGSLRKRGQNLKIPWKYLGDKVKADVEFDAIEDERRLFFVGVTRAKTGVLLTYSKLSENLREQLPSQFLEEIDPGLIEKADTEKFNSKFIEGKDILFDEPVGELSPDKEKYFLKELFLEKGLNVSSLDNFLECPWKYFFVNLISIPAVRNKYQLFGTAIHSTLESLIKNRKNIKDPKSFLIESLKRNLSLQGLSGKDFKEYLQKGKIALTGFYENVFINFPDKIQSELNIRGVKISGSLTLNGRIDMLEEKNGEFIIHDFKTGKPKTRGEIDGSKPDGQYNYLRQLTFYKILLNKFRAGFMKIKTGVIDFVEPDEKSRFKSINFNISEDDVKGLLNTLDIVSKQIYNLSFWNETCGKKNCEWCSLRRVMG